MALITKTFTFSAGAVISASEHNTNFDTVYNEFNGSIDNANIKASAAIVDTKLAQITTASKVSVSAITGTLDVVNGGTGVATLTGLVKGNGTSAFTAAVSGTDYQAALTNPMVYGNTRIKYVTFTRDISLASGDQTVTGTGFQPVGIIFFAGVNSGAGQMSIGFFDGTLNATDTGLSDLNQSVTDTYGLPDQPIAIATSATSVYKGKVSAVSSDGFTITWTKTNTPTGTATIGVLCFR